MIRFLRNRGLSQRPEETPGKSLRFQVHSAGFACNGESCLCAPLWIPPPRLPQDETQHLSRNVCGQHGCRVGGRRAGLRLLHFVPHQRRGCHGRLLGRLGSAPAVLLTSAEGVHVRRGNGCISVSGRLSIDVAERLPFRTEAKRFRYARQCNPQRSSILRCAPGNFPPTRMSTSARRFVPVGGATNQRSFVSSLSRHESCPC